MKGIDVVDGVTYENSHQEQPAAIPMVPVRFGGAFEHGHLPCMLFSDVLSSLRLSHSGTQLMSGPPS